MRILHRLIKHYVTDNFNMALSAFIMQIECNAHGELQYADLIMQVSRSLLLYLLSPHFFPPFFFFFPPPVFAGTCVAAGVAAAASGAAGVASSITVSIQIRQSQSHETLQRQLPPPSLLLPLHNRFHIPSIFSWPNPAISLPAFANAPTNRPTSAPLSVRYLRHTPDTGSDVFSVSLAFNGLSA
jgi:hypothetical protein